MIWAIQEVGANIRNKVKTERGHERGFVVPIRSCDTEPASLNHGITDPKATIGRKRGSTKSICKLEVSQ